MKYGLSGLLILAVGAFAGCGTKETQQTMSDAPTIQPNDVRYVSLPEEDSLGVLEGNLFIWNYRFTPGRQLSLTFENPISTEELRFEAQTVFRDSDGEIVDETSWVPVIIGPSGRHQFIMVTGNRNAIDARVFVRDFQKIEISD